MIKTEDYLRVLETSPIRGQDESILRALRYIDLGYPVMLYGPPGNGKTTIAEHILTHIGGPDSYLKLEATEATTEYQTLGGFHPLSMSGNPELAEKFVYKDGVVSRAIQEKKNLLIDEFTRAPSNAYSGLFLLLSHGRLPIEYKEEVLEKPENWILITTANLGDEGTFKISAALKRRFVPIHVGYASRATEEALLVNITPQLSGNVVKAILDFAQHTRDAWKQDRGLPQGLSTDGVIRMARYCDLSIRQGSDARNAFIDSALHQAIVIADETDQRSMQLAQTLALDIGKQL